MLYSCYLCERDITSRSSAVNEECQQRTTHHLLPRELHEKLLASGLWTRNELLNTVVDLCFVCHAAAHEYFSNSEMARYLSTPVRFKEAMADIGWLEIRKAQNKGNAADQVQTGQIHKDTVLLYKVCRFSNMTLPCISEAKITAPDTQQLASKPVPQITLAQVQQMIDAAVKKHAGEQKSATTVQLEAAIKKQAGDHKSQTGQHVEATLKKQLGPAVAIHIDAAMKEHAAEQKSAIASQLEAAITKQIGDQKSQTGCQVEAALKKQLGPAVAMQVETAMKKYAGDQQSATTLQIETAVQKSVAEQKSVATAQLDAAIKKASGDQKSAWMEQVGKNISKAIDAQKSTWMEQVTKNISKAIDAQQASLVAGYKTAVKHSSDETRAACTAQIEQKREEQDLIWTRQLDSQRYRLFEAMHKKAIENCDRCSSNMLQIKTELTDQIKELKATLSPEASLQAGKLAYLQLETSSLTQRLDAKDAEITAFKENVGKVMCDMQEQIDLIDSDSEDSDSENSSASSEQEPTAVTVEPVEEVQEDELSPAAIDGTVQDTVHGEATPSSTPDAARALPASETPKEGSSANTGWE